MKSRIGLKEAGIIVKTIRQYELGGSINPVTQAVRQLHIKLAMDKDKVWRTARIFGYPVKKRRGEWVENII